MSANAYNLARRLSSRNEPDLLRKCVCCNHFGDLSQESVRMMESWTMLTDFLSVFFVLSHLTEEDMMGDDNKTTPPSSPYTKKACMAMLDKVCPDSPMFPNDCKQFDDVRVALQRKNSNRDSQAIAFAGMPAGEAASAMAARDRGHLHHAQIQRRMTSGKSRTLW